MAHKAFRRFLLAACGFIWVAGVVLGARILFNYETTAGEAGSPAVSWPEASKIARHAGRFTVVLFAHPDCPCTRASLAELDRALVEIRARADVHVLFSKPGSVLGDVQSSELWSKASAMQGVSVAYDSRAAEAERFGARVSGQTVVYDPDGRLLFSGGITESRGHEGENRGIDSVVSLVEGKSKNFAQAPVFGCSLHDPKSQNTARGSAVEETLAAAASARTSDGVAARAAALFEEHHRGICKRADRLFAGLMVVQWIAAIAAALWITPRTWVGQYSQVHLHVWAAIGMGGAITLFPVAMAIYRAGANSTRYVIAASQMLMSALLIDLTGGRIETHFHVFGSLALLAFYRDWRVYIPATLVVAADHFFRGVYWPLSVFGVITASPWRWIEHAGWVLFENAFLIRSCIQSVREMKDIAWQRAELEATNDIVEKKVQERTRDLRHATELAETASNAKSIFLATMSHEIRTPMNGILGMTELVLETELTREQRDSLGLVMLSAESLLVVINDVLDFSKIEAGKLDVEPLPFDFREFLGETMNTLGLRAHQKGSRAGLRRSARCARCSDRRCGAHSTDPGESGWERDQVYGAGRNSGHGFAAGGFAGARRAAFLGARHRDWNSAGEAGQDFRGVLSGGWFHDPAVRRHGAWPDDLQPAGLDSRRTNLGGKRARIWEYVPFHLQLRDSGKRFPGGRADSCEGTAGNARSDRRRQLHQSTSPGGDAYSVGNEADGSGRREVRAAGAGGGEERGSSVSLGVARRADAGGGWVYAGSADSAQSALGGRDHHDADFGGSCGRWREVPRDRDRRIFGQSLFVNRNCWRRFAGYLRGREGSL